MPHTWATLFCNHFSLAHDPAIAFRYLYTLNIISWCWICMTLLCPPTFHRLRPLPTAVFTIYDAVFVQLTSERNRTSHLYIHTVKLVCKWHLVFTWMWFGYSSPLARFYVPYIQYELERFWTLMSQPSGKMLLLWGRVCSVHTNELLLQTIYQHEHHFF